jgi:hypothetical protein
MKKSSNVIKLVLSAICVVIYLFLALASGEGGNSSSPSTPTIIKENPDQDYVSDMAEEEREAEEEYESSVSENNDESTIEENDTVKVDIHSDNKEPKDD